MGRRITESERNFSVLIRAREPGAATKVQLSCPAVSPFILLTQAESGAHLRDSTRSSRFPLGVMRMRTDGVQPLKVAREMDGAHLHNCLKQITYGPAFSTPITGTVQWTIV